MSVQHRPKEKENNSCGCAERPLTQHTHLVTQHVITPLRIQRDVIECRYAGVGNDKILQLLNCT